MFDKLPLRRRVVSACWIAGTILLGLSSRRHAALLPPWLAKNAGDALYATMAYWLVRFVFPPVAYARAFGAAVTFCFLIEFSKLGQPTWLLTLRHTRPGALILGSGFHVTNLLCYVLGALLGSGIDIGTAKRRSVYQSRRENNR